MAKRSSKRRTQREVLSKLHEDGALADATAVHIAMSAPSKVDTKAIGSNGHVSTATVAHGTDEQEKVSVCVCCVIVCVCACHSRSMYDSKYLIV